MVSLLKRNNNLRDPRMRSCKLYSGGLLALFCLGAGTAGSAAAPEARPLEGDYVIHDFHFASGETLPELRMHYTYLGKAKRDAQGRVTNAVLIMHGTGGSGRSLINERFSAVLSQRAKLLDPKKSYTTLPAGTGHGKPSGPRTAWPIKFPKFP